MIAYLCLTEVEPCTIRSLTKVDKEACTDWCNHLRTLVTWDLDNLDVLDAAIGVIEIDESKFNRGHRVEGVGVVGGVE